MIIGYRFHIGTYNTKSQICNPVYDKISKDFVQESGQQFFREKLNCDLKFENEDYDYIQSFAFDTIFLVAIESNITGVWANYFSGTFRKVDCKFDDDNSILTCQLETNDDYKKIFESWEKELNVIDILPETTSVTIRKRPLIQTYVLGDDVVTNMLGGTYWEQQLNIDPVIDPVDLINTYHFKLSQDLKYIPPNSLIPDVSGYYQDSIASLLRDDGIYRIIKEIYYFYVCPYTTGMNENISGYWYKESGTGANNVYRLIDNYNYKMYQFDNSSYNAAYISKYTSGGYVDIYESEPFTSDPVFTPTGHTFTEYSTSKSTTFSSEDQYKRWYIRLESSGNRKYQTEFILFVLSDQNLYGVTFQSLTSASTCQIINTAIYSRHYTDLTSIGGNPTFPVPTTDIVLNNANYSYCLGAQLDCYGISNLVQDEPEQYGKVAIGCPNAGKYFKKLAVTGEADTFPIGRSTWSCFSLWAYSTAALRTIEENNGQDFEFKDCYKLVDVLSAFLNNLGLSSIKHLETSIYSQFFYDTVNPIDGIKIYPLISQKSNIILGEYDQPAKIAKITLRKLFEMLWNTWQVAWHIDDGKLILEHIKYYNNGQSYGTASVETDITVLYDEYNKKYYSFNTNKYEYDKSSIPEQYKYTWMDEVSVAFNGYPIENISNFISKGQIEQRDNRDFTSDVDFILSTPENINKEGFFLMGAIDNGGQLELPFVTMTGVGGNANNVNLMQNGYLSYIYLHKYFHGYNAPCSTIKINNENVSADEVINIKKQQVIFPKLTDPDPLKLVKTGLGNGKVEKLSVNLLNRMVTADLKHAE